MRWVCDLDVSADIIQAECSTECTEHQEVSTTEVIDEKEEPNDRYECFDYAEDASSKERGICTGDTDGFEDYWRVIVDGIDPGGVLPEEKRAAEEESVADFAVVEKSSEWLPKSETNGRVLMLEGGIDRGDFFEHVDIVGVELSNPAEILEGLSALATAHEPTRGFSDKEKADEHQASWDELDGSFHSPLLS